MYPGGIDPKMWRMLQEHAKRAAEINRYRELMSPEKRRLAQEHFERAKQVEEYYGPILERVRVREDFGRMGQDPTRYSAEGNRLPRGISPSVMSSIENATRFLNSPSFKNYMERVRQANRLAETKFGSKGIAAAQRIAARQIQAQFDDVAEHTAERIQNGQADEVLKEAAELAASPEVRELIEQADESTVQQLLEETEEQNTGLLEEDLSFEEDLGFGTEETYPGASKEELLKMHDSAIQILRVLGIAAAVVMITPNPSSGGAAAIWATINALLYLLEFSKQQIAAWDDEE